jgi:hypothetical protein
MHQAFDIIITHDLPDIRCITVNVYNEKYNPIARLDTLKVSDKKLLYIEKNNKMINQEKKEQPLSLQKGDTLRIQLSTELRLVPNTNADIIIVSNSGVFDEQTVKLNP